MFLFAQKLPSQTRAEAANTPMQRLPGESWFACLSSYIAKPKADGAKKEASTKTNRKKTDKETQKRNSHES
jgi:hypothetical protein